MENDVLDTDILGTEVLDTDVLIIGAGIVGLSAAYAVNRAAPGTRVVVVEKEAAPACHQTGRNSGVIHSGIYYRPGSLKARYAVRGAAEMVKFCTEHGIPHQVTGKLIVATERTELPRLHALVQRGRHNGVPVRELGPAQIAEYEPHIRGLAAIHVGTTGVCDYRAVAATLARLACDAGAEIRYGAPVRTITRRGGRVIVAVGGPGGEPGDRFRHRFAARAGRTPAGGTPDGAGTMPGEADTTPDGAGGGPSRSGAGRGRGHRHPADGTTAGSGSAEIRARALVNCAGLHSDRVARLAGHDPGMAILPFRGEYHELPPARADLVRGLVYPVPDPAFPFLGVHLTRDVHGAVHIGPNAVPALAREGYRRGTVRLRDLAETLRFPGTWRVARRHWRQEAAELRRSLSRRAFAESVRRLLPEIRETDLLPAPSGVRAQAVLRDGTLVDDFLFAGEAPFVHVLNAPSPAATASLPVGREVARRALAML